MTEQPNPSSDPTVGLTLLGQTINHPSKLLETFPNQHPGRHYTVTLVCPEFTCVCPMTGQPDFATLHITYVPDASLIELKALKLYINAYRHVGIFHEFVTNKILTDLIAACQPLRMEIEGDFNVRGGIKTVVKASYERPPAA